MDGEWTAERASAWYGVEDWGAGYFGVNAAGRVVVRPTAGSTNELDLFEIVEGLVDRDIATPIVIRFTDILADRLAVLRGVFERAMSDNEYRGEHIHVYPIKVNQQRPVVEEVVRRGPKLSLGLEVGSKPELLAVTALTASDPVRLIVCNGFKDRAYLRGVVTATKLGRRIVPVVEKPTELGELLEESDRLQVRQPLGVRVRLSSRGAGRWEASLGDRSKFGLRVGEILELIEVLRARDRLDSFVLLHCHPGSQIEDIRRLKDAIGELAHLYCELVELGVGLRYIDVGGGLGVNYGGPRGSDTASLNYTLEEYANEIVYRVGVICNDRGVDHPTIVTESGRASAAHQSVLVTQVLGAATPDEPGQVADSFPTASKIAADASALAAGGSTLDTDASALAEEEPQPISDLRLALDLLDEGAFVEAYHDARQAREQVLSLFRLGYVDLHTRALGDRLFWAVCRRIVAEMKKDNGAADVPDELADLPDLLSSTYFCNFSIFQSLPDSWAIDQLFPIMPIHRLGEFPTERAELADLTCDSDGRICRFVSGGEKRNTLDVHTLNDGEPYYLGVFLVGAYQETLGAMHNLFGDNHVVHVHSHEEGGWWIDQVVPGDTIREVLTYSQYETERFAPAISRDCEQGVRDGRLTVAESREIQRYYASELEGYTYLVPE